MGLSEWLKKFRDERAAVRTDSAPEPFDEDVEVDPFNPFPEPIRLEIKDVFDLHTIAPQEVKRVIEEYLLEARRAGFRSVRIIHGKGKGVQREMVRRILARTPFVEDWTDAPPEAGGLGATIARLSSQESQRSMEVQRRED
jgi:dsDNA-specific endonuclease/ATPase MutS2